MTITTVTDRSALAAALRDLKTVRHCSALSTPRLAQAHAGRTRPPGLLAGPVPGRDLPPRHTWPWPAGSAAPGSRHPATLEGFDFARTRRSCPQPRSRDLAALALAAIRRVRHPLRPGRRRQEPRRPGPRSPGHPIRRRGPVPQDQPGPWPNLAGGHADRTWGKRLAELTRPAVLVLDDFAIRELTAAQADDLYELITERAGKSLILTSNRAPADWYPLFPNPVVAESLLDRLINTSHQVFMNGPSYRPNKRPGRVVPTGTASGN